MSNYNQEFNKDNVILRYIIVATLAELRNKVYYYNRIDEDTDQKIEIPFYHSITGGERFLSDTFVYGIEDDEAIGDYEVVPRGVLELSSLGIDSGNMVNKFVRSRFVKEYEGELKTFALETTFLPLTLSFDVTLICSNILEMLKSSESIMSKLYKATYFQIDLGMFRVEASLEVSEDFSQTRLLDFSLNDKKEFNVTFPIEIKTFMPVFENGITLSEIDKLIKDSENNPNREGIGMFRNGAIYFGGVLQELENNILDISDAPEDSAFSNREEKEDE